MNKKEFAESMSCRNGMKRQALVWSMVREVSKLLNDNNVSYDEFIEIMAEIDHYTHHEAEMVQFDNEIEYKRDNEIPMDEDLDYDEIDPDDLEWIVVDIDDCDGEYFPIPAI